MKESSVSLEQSAREFLGEALLNFKQGKWNFSILHAVTATELLLKEKLSRIHPNLVFQKIDSLIDAKSKSVGLDFLPQRLANFGVSISKNDLHLIDMCAKWRHQIVHHMPTFQQEKVSSRLDRLFDFLSRFLDQEFHLSMRVFLPKPIFNEVGKFLREWKKVVDDARVKAQARGKIVNNPCPECGASKVLTLGGRDGRDGYVFCHLCESEIHLSFCKQCQRFIVGLLNEIGGGRDVCDKCMDDEIDAWIELQGDVSEGR